MDCDEFVELVTAFLDGALDDPTEERFLAHIAACDGCDVYLDQIRRTTRDLGALEPTDLTPAARDHLLAAFRDWRSAS